jgi:hypothetical protein
MQTQFGTNIQKTQKARVYYEASSTIYEGMPVCFNYDTTTNILGWSDSSGAKGTTTAEGYQNEGKFLRVEDPVTANLQWFAGVVAGNEYAGKTGPRWLDIYVPNGAIVPVRSYISSTVGVNALAIMNGTQYFGRPTAGMGNGAARYVAVAEETVNRSSTAGLCLAKLIPDQFMYQTAGTAKMVIATAGTVETIANFINVHSAQTTGTFTALFVRSEIDTADSGDVALAVYGEANVLGVAAGSYCIGNRFSLNLWGGTQTAGYIHALGAEIYEEGANLTGSTVISPLFLRTQIDATNPPAANSHYMMTCRCDGADKPDGLLYAVSADAIKFEAVSSGTTASHHIPIRVAGTTYYILVEDTA